MRALAAESGRATSSRPKSVIYIFLSGGLAQHDSFDPKPQTPDSIRGEFSPIATRTPGIQICEHLPRLAACSDKWALVRSLTHPYNEHSLGHHVMLTGWTATPVGFDSNRPTARGYPKSDPQTSENMAATIYEALGLPRNLAWKDRLDRPHLIYHGHPISGLT